MALSQAKRLVCRKLVVWLTSALCLLREWPAEAAPGWVCIGTGLFQRTDFRFFSLSTKSRTSPLTTGDCRPRLPSASGWGPAVMSHRAVWGWVSEICKVMG